MNLYELFSSAGISADLPRCEVSGVTESIDNVTRGSVFVAVKGESHDGNEFTARALEKGAVCVVCENASDDPHFVTVTDARLSLSMLCDAFYGHPHRKMKMIGVTGTNGKTTVCEYIAHILTLAGKRCAVLGTLGARSCGHSSYTGYTTPSPEILYRALNGFVEDGCEYCIMEVSSQALSQKRVDPISFRLGIFINIGTDHLDYHKSFENYLGAKLRLAGLSEMILINADDLNFSTAVEAVGEGKYLFTAKDRYADFYAKDIRYNKNGSSYIFFDKKNIVPLEVNGAGELFVCNSLCAFAAAQLLLDDCSIFPDAAKSLPSVRGRMQKISCGNKDVIIDFAHTPQALEAVLGDLRRSVQGRIITVFGCGGERDRGKRPLMGAAATAMSDAVIITDDNPRGEASSEIIGDILSGIARKRNVSVEPDRQKAIEKAIKKAKAGDTVLIAGKGHEEYQLTGSCKQYFSDELTVKRIFGLV